MAGLVLVDSNVLLDVLEDDQQWYGWSSEQLARCAGNSVLVINPIIYSEVSIGFERVEDLEDALPASEFVRRPLPWEAAFLAGKCFLLSQVRRNSQISPAGFFHRYPRPR